jgi:hypothetical protein
MITVIRSLFVDLVIVTGLALIAVGAWLIYPPAALITIGVLLLIGGVARSVTGGRYGSGPR